MSTTSVLTPEFLTAFRADLIQYVEAYWNTHGDQRPPPVPSTVQEWFLGHPTEAPAAVMARVCKSLRFAGSRCTSSEHRLEHMNINVDVARFMVRAFTDLRERTLALEELSCICTAFSRAVRCDNCWKLICLQAPEWSEAYWSTAAR